MTPAAAVSVMIFTLNEEIHLPSCLAALEWCDDVIVIDSFSTDRTEALCRERGVRFFLIGSDTAFLRGGTSAALKALRR